MKWVRLIGAMPFILGGAVCAQSANESGLESCFRATRLTDAICTKQDDPTQRLDCLRKASAAQLECLEQVLPEAPKASENSSGTAPSETPAKAASSDPSSNEVSPKGPDRTESPEVPTGSVANRSNSPPEANFKTDPPKKPASSDTPIAAIRSDEPVERPDIPARPADTNWIVSETTSPVDYSPLVTAVIHPTPGVKHGPTL
jgi:hypothetical protein